MKKVVWFLIACFYLLDVQAGGGWTSGKGKGYFKLGQSAIVAKDYFSPSGEVIPITTTGFYATYFYGEYGLSNKWDVIVYMPFFQRSTVNDVEDLNGNLLIPGDELSSFGDTDISLKYGILSSGPFVLATTLTLGLPIGNPAGGATNVLQTGDGEFNQMLTLDLSRSFGKFYGTVMTGYNNRTEGFANEFRYGIEAGISIKDFWIILRSDGVKPVGKSTVENQQDVTGVFSNRIEYLSVTPQIAWQANEKIGISASFGGAIYGKRILAAPNIGLGVYLKI